MAKASLLYKVDLNSTRVFASGMEVTEEQLDEAIQGPVIDLLYDTTGNKELLDMLSEIASTDFRHSALTQLVKNESQPYNWQIGEALGETYVVSKHNCEFPWNWRRGLKNPEASAPGADLTGFQLTNDKTTPYRFAFGEVKTSSDDKSPPNVMYGRTGLKHQLNLLTSSFPTKRNLVMYLGHHAVNAEWRYMYSSAFKRCLNSKFTDLAIFGILVRDVSPNESDLLSLASSLVDNCSVATRIWLNALYLPKQSIASLQSRVLQSRATKSLLNGDK